MIISFSVVQFTSKLSYQFKFICIMFFTIHRKDHDVNAFNILISSCYESSVILSRLKMDVNIVYIFDPNKREVEIC